MSVVVNFCYLASDGFMDTIVKYNKTIGTQICWLIS